MTKKKSLRILPEVLPAPTVRADGEGVRARTREHMHRLLAAAALTSAALSTACDKGQEKAAPHDSFDRDAGPEPIAPRANSTGYAVVDPLPQPPPPQPPRVDAGRPVPRDAAVHVDNSKGHGYRVVDPMPPPGRRRGPNNGIP